MSCSQDVSVPESVTDQKNLAPFSIDPRDLTFDLSHDTVAIVGHGDVAADAARILEWMDVVWEDAIKLG